MKYVIGTRTLLIALMFAVGCQRSDAPKGSAPSEVPVKSVSYKYEIRGGGTFASGEAETIQATVGKNVLLVQDGRLTVNGKAYGGLKDKDMIVVDESGKVTVNGQTRFPE
jgi:hypothetical protein